MKEPDRNKPVIFAAVTLFTCLGLLSQQSVDYSSRRTMVRSQQSREVRPGTAPAPTGVGAGGHGHADRGREKSRAV
jgi:hypothetical protein